MVNSSRAIKWSQCLAQAGNMEISRTQRFHGKKNKKIKKTKKNKKQKTVDNIYCVFF